jgi:hypothetical protein
VSTIQTAPKIDTLPPAVRDERLEYKALSGHLFFCRFRLYRAAGVPVLVLTQAAELDGVEPVEHACERAFYLAWEAAGQPWPCAFVIHKRAWLPNAMPGDMGSERVWEISFRSYEEWCRPTLTAETRPGCDEYLEAWMRGEARLLDIANFRRALIGRPNLG